jgi:hypothetical protein
VIDQADTACHGPECRCMECDDELAHDRDTLTPTLPQVPHHEYLDQLALAVLPTALQHLLSEYPSGEFFSVDTLAQRAHDLAAAMVAWRPR